MKTKKIAGYTVPLEVIQRGESQGSSEKLLRWALTNLKKNGILIYMDDVQNELTTQLRAIDPTLVLTAFDDGVEAGGKMADDFYCCWQLAHTKAYGEEALRSQYKSFGGKPDESQFLGFPVITPKKRREQLDKDVADSAEFFRKNNPA